MMKMPVDVYNLLPWHVLLLRCEWPGAGGGGGGLNPSPEALFARELLYPVFQRDPSVCNALCGPMTASFERHRGLHPR